MYEYGVVPPVTVFEKVTLWPVSIDWDVKELTQFDSDAVKVSYWPTSTAEFDGGEMEAEQTGV